MLRHVNHHVFDDHCTQVFTGSGLTLWWMITLHQAKTDFDTYITLHKVITVIISRKEIKI